MGLRRRNLVLWSQSGNSVGRLHVPPRTRLTRMRRRLRVGLLMTVVALLSVSSAIRPRWRPLLAGLALTVTGFVMRHNPGSIALLPGMLLLLTAPLTPACPGPDRRRLGELRRELAVYSSPAERRDLEAVLDRYPDSDTRELRTILAAQRSP